MSEKKNELELYVAEGLKRIDKQARPTRGSGCGNEIGDVSNKYFFVECKQKRTKENIIMDYKEEWLSLASRLPLNTNKIPVIAIENRYGDRFVIMSSEDFFRLAKEAKGDD
jgi:hypothetical protein